MFDVDVKNIKKEKKIYYLFLFTGLLFAGIGVGIFIADRLKLQRMDAQVEAHNVEIERYRNDGDYTYSPVHYFTVNGVEYTCNSNSSSSSETVDMYDETVYYNSNDPSDCMTEYSSSLGFTFLIIFGLVGGGAAFVGFINIHKINKRIKMVKYLNQNGKLIKNMPYRMENTNVSVNGVAIQRPVVDYRLPSGSVIKLSGDGRYDGKYRDEDGFVDVLIDPNNLNNYFIDFEINRLSGNLASDYYKPTKEELESMKNSNPSVAQFNNNSYNNNHY